MKRILITPRSLTKSGHPALEKLTKAGYKIIFSTPGKQPSEEELIKLLVDCAGYLAGVEKISSKVLENAKNLRVISRNGSGIDNIDLKTAERLNIRICKTEGANARGVAELTMGLMFSLIRSIPYHNEKMKNEVWERKKGIEIKDRILGLIGCGKIGQKVALLALGLGMKVLAYRRHPDLSFSPSENFKWVDLEEVLVKSDIISLHRPASHDNKPIITKEIIKRMKKDVYLINTARDSLIDDNAVLEALENNHIAGLAVDVYNEEPPVDYCLIKHDRVIATPHIGGYTEESVLRATEAAVDNLVKYLT